MRRKQQGLTMIGWAGAISVSAFFLVFFLAVIPAYFDGSAAQSVIEDLETDPKTRLMTSVELKNTIEKRMSINSIKIDLKKALKIKRLARGDRLVTLNYEIRRGFLFNIDLVLKFDAEVTLKGSSDL